MELERGDAETLCFVPMPLKEELEGVYTDAIKPAAEAVGLLCERADEIMAPGIILEQVESRIQRAQIIVADLTGSNPNVAQELGYARAPQKPVILLAPCPRKPTWVRDQVGPLSESYPFVLTG